jgi:hypothetical protein
MYRLRPDACARERPGSQKNRCFAKSLKIGRIPFFGRNHFINALIIKAIICWHVYYQLPVKLIELNL